MSACSDLWLDRAQIRWDGLKRVTDRAAAEQPGRSHRELLGVQLGDGQAGRHPLPHVDRAAEDDGVVLSDAVDLFSAPNVHVEAVRAQVASECRGDLRCRTVFAGAGDEDLHGASFARAAAARIRGYPVRRRSVAAASTSAKSAPPTVTATSAANQEPYGPPRDTRASAS